MGGLGFSTVAAERTWPDEVMEQLHRAARETVSRSGREAGPFAPREDCDLVVRGRVELMAMPSAGDLVIYGTGAAEGNISSIPARAAHAGPAPEELHTFIVHPEAVHLFPPAITHPLQLYAKFIRYQRSRGLGDDAFLLRQGRDKQTFRREFDCRHLP